MSTKKEFLTELVKSNGLDIDEDIFRLTLGGKQVAIITRAGIEKIQYHNNIEVRYYVESIVPPESALATAFVVVKAVAKKGDVRVESFGEASANNTKQSYPVAMAEKRALARVVLKISGAYKYGVFGEDESDDFKGDKS